MPLRGLRYMRQGVMLSRKREGGKVLVSGALEQVVSRPSGRRRPMCQHRNKPFTAASCRPRTMEALGRSPSSVQYLGRSCSASLRGGKRLEEVNDNDTSPG